MIALNAAMAAQLQDFAAKVDARVVLRRTAEAGYPDETKSAYIGSSYHLFRRQRLF